jgi:hypothetical protein
LLEALDEEEEEFQGVVKIVIIQETWNNFVALTQEVPYVVG